MTQPSIKFSDSLGASWRMERNVSLEPAIVVYATSPGGDEVYVVIPEPDIDQFIESLTAAKRLPRLLKPRS